MRNDQSVMGTNFNRGASIRGASIGGLDRGAINRFGGKSSITNAKVIGHDLGNQMSSSREFT